MPKIVPVVSSVISIVKFHRYAHLYVLAYRIHPALFIRQPDPRVKGINVNPIRQPSRITHCDMNPTRQVDELTRMARNNLF